NRPGSSWVQMYFLQISERSVSFFFLDQTSNFRNFPITTENFPITTENFPITTENFPITTENFPITTENFPITTENFPITTENFPQTFLTGSRNFEWKYN